MGGGGNVFPSIRVEYEWASVMVVFYGKHLVLIWVSGLLSWLDCCWSTFAKAVAI